MCLYTLVPMTGYFFMTEKLKTEKLMARAISLAVKGMGYTSPNPVVGCLIVKNDKIIASDYHHKAGQPHAEILALNKAGKAAKGAVLYVTLEPCCLHGRTPPCTKAIIQAGIKKIVIGIPDPNPDVNGRGIKKLEKAGIEVVTGALEEQCRDLNKGYNKYITTGLPYVTIKCAQSLDGRIATKTGSSRWISSDESLKFAHKLRAHHDAILVGADTVNNDDPQLTVRLVKGKNPVRVILTSSGRIKNNLQIFSDSISTIIATGSKGLDNFKRKNTNNVELIKLPEKSGSLNLKVLLQKLADRGITSLLVEGGSKTITGFIKQKLADRIIVVTAPILIGDGINGIGDLGIKTINNSLKLKNIKYRKIGIDNIVVGDLS